MVLAAKIVIELLLLVILVVLSNAFWSPSKLPRMFKDVFGNREMADAAVRRNKNKEFHKSTVVEMARLEQMLPNATDSVGFMVLLGSYFEATIKTWKRVKNFHFIVLGCLIAASWMISPYVMLLNMIVCAVWGRLVTASPDAIAEMLGSFQVLAVIIEEWYDRFPSECEKFCTRDSAQFSTVFSAVTEFGTIPYSDWK